MNLKMESKPPHQVTRSSSGRQSSLDQTIVFGREVCSIWSSNSRKIIRTNLQKSDSSLICSTLIYTMTAASAWTSCRTCGLPSTTFAAFCCPSKRCSLTLTSIHQRTIPQRWCITKITRNTCKKSSKSLKPVRVLTETTTRKWKNEPIPPKSQAEMRIWFKSSIIDSWVRIKRITELLSKPLTLYR